MTVTITWANHRWEQLSGEFPDMSHPCGYDQFWFDWRSDNLFLVGGHVWACVTGYYACNALCMWHNIQNCSLKRQGWMGMSTIRAQGIHNFLLARLPWLSHCGQVTPYGDTAWSTLAQVMAWCLTAPSHYLNQCWLIVSTDQWCLSKGNFTRDTPAINEGNQLQFAKKEFLSNLPGANELCMFSICLCTCIKENFAQIYLPRC